ncbi:MAG: hypothetical protein ACPG7F_05545 [Aggregatilineales bacterium]
MDTKDLLVRFEYFGDVRIEYFDDEKIAVFISDGNEIKHVDNYINAIKTHFEKSPNSDLYFCLDISRSRYGLYAVSRFRELHNIVGKRLSGRIAVVIKNDIIGSSIRIFADNQLKRHLHERKFFHNRADAIAWLRQGLEQSQISANTYQDGLPQQ